jgi:hypothetical protein
MNKGRRLGKGREEDNVPASHGNEREQLCRTVIVFLTQVEPAIKINCAPSLPQVPPPLSFTMKMNLWFK